MDVTPFNQWVVMPKVSACLIVKSFIHKHLQWSKIRGPSTIPQLLKRSRARSLPDGTVLTAPYHVNGCQLDELRVPCLPPAMHHLVSFMWTCDYVKLYFVAFIFTLLKNKRITITTVNLRIEYCCTLGYRPKTHLKLKSCEISFVHIIPNLLKFCTVHGIDTTVVCIKLQNDSKNDKISYRQARFRKIWAYAEFRRCILCCNSPKGPLTQMTRTTLLPSGVRTRLDRLSVYQACPLYRLYDGNPILLRHLPYIETAYRSHGPPEFGDKFCMPPWVGIFFLFFSVQWRRNERDGVSNHRRDGCLFNRLFRRRLKNHPSSASLTFVRGIHRWPVDSPHKGPVARKMFPFDDVIM